MDRSMCWRQKRRGFNSHPGSAETSGVLCSPNTAKPTRLPKFQPLNGGPRGTHGAGVWFWQFPALQLCYQFYRGVPICIFFLPCWSSTSVFEENETQLWQQTYCIGQQLDFSRPSNTMGGTFEVTLNSPQNSEETLKKVRAVSKVIG